jgi:hypothetical protein
MKPRGAVCISPKTPEATRPRLAARVRIRDEIGSSLGLAFVMFSVAVLEVATETFDGLLKGIAQGPCRAKTHAAACPKGQSLYRPWS